MAQYVAALSIAGSDCSGGAGIQADIKTMSALGVYAATAITAITVQDGFGVIKVDPVSADTVSQQIMAVMKYITPKAVKIGMLCNRQIVEAVSAALSHFNDVPIIVDPVIAASDSSPLIDEEAIPVFKECILPMATLITPNIPESHILSGEYEDMDKVASTLLDFCNTILIKGGHSDNPDTACDMLYSRGGYVRRYEAPRLVSENTHGTGCTLSSAIAAYVAMGYSLQQACDKAKEYMSMAIDQGRDVAFPQGSHGPLNHFFNPKPIIKL